MLLADQGKMGCVGCLAKMSRTGFVDRGCLTSHNYFVRTGTTQAYSEQSARMTSC